MKKLLIFCFVCFVTTNLFARPNVNIEFNHYYISPMKVNEVVAELFSNTPIKMGSEKYLAETNWQIKYKYNSQYNVKLCKVDTVSVDLDVEYIMPQVSNSVPAKIKHKFKRFYKKLLTHEQTHKNNGLKAAKEIERKIRAKSQEKNCDILNSKIKKMADSIISKYARLDRLYDERTQHGRSEGLVVKNYFK